MCVPENSSMRVCGRRNPASFFDIGISARSLDYVGNASFMRQVRAVILSAAILAVVFFLTSGSFLVLNEPRKADVIVVLAGETNFRPKKGVELLRGGYAPQLIFDVPAAEDVYGLAETELAGNYVKALPEANQISVCPIYGLSTKAETRDVQRCLRGGAVKSVLIVTSEYHTRRSLTTFRHELPQYGFSIAAASNPEEFGRQWWRHRQWAKINFDEWVRLVWWTAIDRWH